MPISQVIPSFFTLVQKEVTVIKSYVFIVEILGNIQKHMDEIKITCAPTT